jgi:hypothetical protein
MEKRDPRTGLTIFVILLTLSSVFTGMAIVTLFPQPSLGWGFLASALFALTVTFVSMMVWIWKFAQEGP